VSENNGTASRQAVEVECTLIVSVSVAPYDSSSRRRVNEVEWIRTDSLVGWRGCPLKDELIGGANAVIGSIRGRALLQWMIVSNLVHTVSFWHRERHGTFQGFSNPASI
jgi:hypothetical protein